MHFCKFHGFGNDYIVIERGDIPAGCSVDDLAKAICQRHTGAGADGIAVIGTDSVSDFFCEIVNPDGGIAGFSGNGTRCAVAYLYYKRLWSQPTLRLRTRSGEKRYELLVADGGYVFRAEIGKPKFAADEIPFLSEPGAAAAGFRRVASARRRDPPASAGGSDKLGASATGFPNGSVINRELKVGDKSLDVSCVNVGNPVACVFVDEFEEDWKDLGRQLETHPAFPARVNIVFVKTLDRENIDIRIWERGAGETSASGTCSAGSAVLSSFTGRTGRHVAVHSPGGVTEVLWRDDGEILLTGRADLSYCGEWPIAQARP